MAKYILLIISLLTCISCKKLSIYDIQIKGKQTQCIIPVFCFGTGESCTPFPSNDTLTYLTQIKSSDWYKLSWIEMKISAPVGIKEIDVAHIGKISSKTLFHSIMPQYTQANYSYSNDTLQISPLPEKTTAIVTFTRWNNEQGFLGYFLFFRIGFLIVVIVLLGVFYRNILCS